jgi:hypothetical protein
MRWTRHLFLTLVTALPGAASGDGKTRFQITYPASAHAGPLTGRAYVILSRTNEKEPRLQVDRMGVPFFGKDFEAVAPGEPITIDADDLGSPVDSLADIPAEDYYVQAFINIYSEFRRKDGHVVWMHDDRWEGQHWQRSPGNLYSPEGKAHPWWEFATAIQ